MSPLPTVVVVAGDAGGAAALAPVLRRLMSDGRVGVRAFAYRQAAELWGRERIAFEPAPGPSCDAALDEALAPAAVLLTGTSVNEQQIENRFIRCANQRGVPAIAVMDFWSNYRRRFCDAKDGWMCRPDLVAVMDERARRDMLREGFDEAQLVVTGQPAWDDLAARRLSASVAARAAVRASLGVQDGALLVAFLSQPLAKFYESHFGDALALGYNERSVCADLLAALRSIATRRGCRVTLVVRPHPREEDSPCPAQVSGGLDVRASREPDPYPLLLAADLVAGMSTALLIDACLLGCITVSLQPGLKGRDALPSNEWGWSTGVYERDRIEPVLETLLLSASARSEQEEKLRSIQMPRDASRSVADLVYRHAGSRALSSRGGEPS